MNVYFDASVLVALFADDFFSARLRKAMKGRQVMPVVSDFAAAEFASVIARLVRTKELSAKEAREAFSSFDAWVENSAASVQSSPEDIKLAVDALRRLNMNLRAPDAIHIAVASRLGAELATFDTRMSDCAKILGVAISKL